MSPCGYGPPFQSAAGANPSPARLCKPSTRGPRKVSPAGPATGPGSANDPAETGETRPEDTTAATGMSQYSNNEADPRRKESNNRLKSPVKKTPKPPKVQKFHAVLPECWTLLRPRRGLLWLG